MLAQYFIDVLIKKKGEESLRSSFPFLIDRRKRNLKSRKKGYVHHCELKIVDNSVRKLV